MKTSLAPHAATPARLPRSNLVLYTTSTTISLSSQIDHFIPKNVKCEQKRVECLRFFFHHTRSFSRSLRNMAAVSRPGGTDLGHTNSAYSPSLSSGARALYNPTRWVISGRPSPRRSQSSTPRCLARDIHLRRIRFPQHEHGLLALLIQLLE